MSELFFPKLRLKARVKKWSNNNRKLKQRKGMEPRTILEASLILHIRIDDRDKVAHLRALALGNCFMDDDGAVLRAFALVLPVKPGALKISVFRAELDDKPYFALENVQIKRLLLSGTPRAGCLLQLPLAGELNIATAEKIAKSFTGEVFIEFAQVQGELPLNGEQGGGEEKPPENTAGANEPSNTADETPAAKPRRGRPRKS